MSPAAVLLALAALAPHPQSLSSSRVEVAGAEARVTLRCQALSVVEVLPELDFDGDGALDAEEVLAGGPRLLNYATARYRLFTGSDAAGEGGAPLAPSAGTARYLAPSDESDLTRFGGAVELAFTCRADDELRELAVECTLFREVGSEHVDLATVVWPDGTNQAFTLSVERPRARASAGGGGTFGVFWRLGLDHILGGWDHLAFLFALLLSSRRLRAVLGWVTAFTVAHSVTLALATLGVVDVSAWDRLVESAIALSIAYVAADTLWRPGLARGRWVEAFVFGLLHGLGFAGFLSESLVLEASKATALFAFNVGVESGQLVVVALLAAPFALAARRRDPRPEFLLPKPLRVGGAWLVLALGLWWFFQRV
ncbi:MAG: HupE/UreJ family protein [Planctomycetes bacterium]|nr:HupE/UreJ family protein [Planctomycetota bacterium]